VSHISTRTLIKEVIGSVKRKTSSKYTDVSNAVYAGMQERRVCTWFSCTLPDYLDLSLMYIDASLKTF